MKSLKTQAADLRTSVNKNQLTKEEFKQCYQTELTDAINNSQYAEKISLSIHALEPEYQRISGIIQKELARLASKDSVFNAVLQRDSVSYEQ